MEIGIEKFDPLCTCDYVGEIIRHANFGFNRYSGGFSRNRRNIVTFLTVLSCPVLTPDLFSRSCAQVEPLDRFSRFMAQTTCFRARMVLLGIERWVTIFGGICPKTPIMGVNRQFQSKTAKYKNHNYLQNCKHDQYQS